MPANSTIALKNTSINDTPYDENIFLLTISLFWIGSFIYFSFIRKRTAYELHSVKMHLTEFILISNFMFICLHLILIIFALYRIFKKNNNNVSSTFMKNIHNFCHIVFVKPFTKLQDILAPHIPYSSIFFL